MKLLAKLALLAAVTSLILAPCVSARVHDSLDLLPSGRSYDFVVIGGGTTGAIIASRLTEDTRLSVLLVEAGPNNEGVEELQAPGLWNQIDSTLYHWGYNTTAQLGLNNRTLAIANGHVLGGTSAISGGVYHRGSQDDYDSWARLTGDQGWSWSSMLRYAKKHERWTPPVGGRNITGQFDPRVHGFTGKTYVSLRQDPPRAFDTRALQTARDFPDDFRAILDPNGGKPIGLSWTQSLIGNGERSNTAAAYLTPNVRIRHNLDIVLNTHATRILPSGSRSSTHNDNLDLRTVELATRPGISYIESKSMESKRVLVTARKEVILAAGGINTPKILLLSGIGEREQLEALGIEVIHELADVGKTTSDQTVSPVAFFRTNESAIPPFDPEDALEQWRRDRTGPLAETLGLQYTLFTRIPRNSTIWNDHSDPSAGKDTPHLELYFINNGNLVGAVIILLTPKSRGSITLTSSNPFDAPLINPNYLLHSFDLEAIREGARMMHKFFSGPAWQSSVVGPVTPSPDDTVAFDAAVRGATITTSHITGGAAMSRRGARGGVLEPDSRVKGVGGMRVVDVDTDHQNPKRA